MRATLRERLYARLTPCADPACDCAGCLLWSGTLNCKGYGQVSVNGQNKAVHRVLWQLENGPLPDGLVLDHVKARGCRHKNCASLAHLEPVTQRENLLRGDTIIAAAVAAIHCPAKHPYDQANTYQRPNGDRTCRACHRDQERRRKARLRLAAHRKTAS